MTRLTKNLVLREPGAARTSIIQEPSLGWPVYWFIGYPSALFRRFAPLIYLRLNRHVGVVVGDSYVNDHSHMTLHGDLVPLITLDEFSSLALNHTCEVIHFFERSEEFWVVSQLESLTKVSVIDFLKKLDQFDLPHTYISVSKEREWWASQNDHRIAKINNRFGDPRSRKTFQARIESIKSGDRKPLIDIMVRSDYEYFNPGWPTGSFVPRENEIYVDCGAASGDTVEKFIQVTKGRFDAIYAFEPSPSQYQLLACRAILDNRVQTYPSAVGDEACRSIFYDNQYNPFGSNLISGDSNCNCIEVDCVRLDDVVEACTMVKMDIEGFEKRALAGAARLIRECRPDLAVTCYHYPQDLIDIIDFVESIHEYKYLALRHYSTTLYDSILLFSDRQSFD